MEKLMLNPFENDIVSEPRRIEKAVSGLNDKALEALLRQFESLEQSPLPRKTRLSHAQFVASPQPGYGKSHLIGRLFRKLNQRATLIYLRPFEDPSTCWKSILLKMVQELDFPDQIGIESVGTEEPTQIEAFAHGILVHLIANAVQTGMIRTTNKNAVLDYLRDAKVQKVRNNKNWVDWVYNNYNALVKQCSRQLQRNGIKLNASPFSWLGVLFSCAYFSSVFERKETCLDWLQGGSIDADEVKRIGIKPRDIPHAEMNAGESNELCKHRIIDFCKFAGFFRPFLFCFDQTENYGKDIQLSKSFGSVIQILADETCNQMTVVTANQVPWSKSIRPWWEDAYLNRLGSPLELEGLNRDHSIELIEHRFNNLDQLEKQRFMADETWLNDFFGQGNEMGVRDFLQRCRNRWQVIQGQPVPDIDIKELYKKGMEQLKAQPKRLVFDPNTLYWLVHEAASGIYGLHIEKYTSPKGYFTLKWKLENQEIFFGFESTSNSSRWKAIMREANIHYQADTKTKAVLFRTSELSKIPGPRWQTIGPKITKAMQQYLHILYLEKSEMIKLYAAHDLYVDAGEENIPFQRHEVLSFIREELEFFWKRVKQPLFQDKTEDKSQDTIKDESQDNTDQLISDI